MSADAKSFREFPSMCGPLPCNCPLLGGSVLNDDLVPCLDMTLLWRSKSISENKKNCVNMLDNGTEANQADTRMCATLRNSKQF